jgi:hypothetical protein
MAGVLACPESKQKSSKANPSPSPSFVTLEKFHWQVFVDLPPVNNLMGSGQCERQKQRNKLPVFATSGRFFKFF